jgi:hypothetical protein
MLIISIVLLAIMVIFPFYMLIESWTEDFIDLGHRGEDVNFDQTDIQSFFADATVRHQTLLTILGVGEAVLLIAFILTFRSAIKPELKPKSV